MHPFILRSELNPDDRAQLWDHSSRKCPPPPSSTNKLNVALDPSEYPPVLRSLYSINASDHTLRQLIARAYAQLSDSSSRAWWPDWVFTQSPLADRIGTPVQLTEFSELFGARFVWSGIPCPCPCPRPEHVTAPTRDAFFAPCMVSLVTHKSPEDKRAYLWCTVNLDGDAIPLDPSFLRALLAPEIANLKTYVKRTGDRTLLEIMANSHPRDAYVNAARLMTLNLNDVAPLVPGGILVPAPAVHTNTSTGDSGHFLTPIATAAVTNRGRVLNIVQKSVAKKIASGESIVTPFLAADATTADREKFIEVIRYFIHYGQFDPAVKRALAAAPQMGDYAAITRDPVFRDFIRTMGCLFLTE